MPRPLDGELHLNKILRFAQNGIWEFSDKLLASKECMRKVKAGILLMAVCGFFAFGLWEESMGKLKGDRSDSTGQEAIMHGAFWRDQALHDIMPAWLAHGIDPASGRFYTDLSRDWRPIGTTDQYPTMLGRHLFSLSAAYLLSGQERYLPLAKDTAAYLIEQGWDHEFGGWYDLITETSTPKTTTKGAFTQMYAWRFTFSPRAIPMPSAAWSDRMRSSRRAHGIRSTKAITSP